MGQPIERNSGRPATTTSLHWKDIPWTVVEGNVSRIQKRIFRATRKGDFRKVRSLQRLLSGSRDARLLAIRRITQINQGKDTAGIDGKIYNKDVEKEQLIEEILLVDLDTYICMPVRRVHIPKPGKDEKRPLGIPVVKDRVLQMVVKLALEPEWEAKFEPHSYGFRPGRRTMDAISEIRHVVAKRRNRIGSAWILDADIAKCFDNIDHEALLSRIHSFKNAIRGWLKAGAIEFGRFYMTKSGTPQGGVISPLLANIALDGMDDLFGTRSRSGKYLAPAARTGKNKGIIVVRYADDLVVMAPSREIIVEYVIPKLRAFLKERGLTLNGAKTRIVHREEGFDFLGFHIRQFVNKNQKFCLVKPSKENVKRHLDKIKDILMKHKQDKQSDLIDELNPILRGWAYYFRYCNAKKTFEYVDHRMFKMLWWWSRRRHKTEEKGTDWVKKKYFMRIGNRDWNFADSPDHAIFLAVRIKCDIRSYVKVKGDASPFDPSLNDYWLKRHGKIPQSA